MILPFRFPNRIDPDNGEFDRGFLKSIFSSLTTQNPITDYSEIIMILDEFSRIHSRMLMYSDGQGRGWFVDNYAYEALVFLPHKKALGGRNYHVTRFDCSSSDGMFSTLESMEQERSPVVLPIVTCLGNLKGIISAQRYKNRFLYLTSSNSRACNWMSFYTLAK